MKLCPLCEKIKSIRVSQGKEYFVDLCHKCKIKYLTEEVHKKTG
jgi:Zn-finger nucleic acid-binding protein